MSPTWFVGHIAFFCQKLSPQEFTSLKRWTFTESETDAQSLRKIMNHSAYPLVWNVTDKRAHEKDITCWPKLISLTKKSKEIKKYFAAERIITCYRKVVFIWDCLLIFFSFHVNSGACYITGQWVASSEQNKRNLTLTLKPNYLLLFFITKFVSLSWFYGFITFTAYLRLIS